MIIRGSSANDIWMRALRALIDEGQPTSPRDMGTRELLGVTYELDDPQSSILGNHVRRLNYQFMMAEALWMLCGFNRVDLIEPFNKNIVMAADDGDHFQGAYGVRILDQIEYVVELLKEDLDSRQAVIEIWRPRPRPTKDVPCTLAMQFLVRGGRLHMHTFMRSQDIWLGTPYDLFNFTLVQQVIAHRLSVDLGTYRHTMGSLHIYDRNIDQAHEVLRHGDPGNTVNIRVPRVWDLPMAALSGAYAELATIAPTLVPDGRVHEFIDEWWEKWAYHINEAQPWADMLVVLARRFSPDYDSFSDEGWYLLMEIGR